MDKKIFGHFASSVTKRKLSQTDGWRAGCRESGKSGSERGAKDNVLCSGRTRAASPMPRALLLLYTFSVARSPLMQADESRDTLNNYHAC